MPKCLQFNIHPKFSRTPAGVLLRLHAWLHLLLPRTSVFRQHGYFGQHERHCSLLTLSPILQAPTTYAGREALTLEQQHTYDIRNRALNPVR